MRAVVQRRFGPPSSLELAEVEVPSPGPGEVLLRMRAAGVNPADWHLVRGDPRIARLLGVVGVRRPKRLVAGVDGSGVVEAVGPGVSAVVGDEVYGWVRGAFAEYALADAARIAPKPPSLGFEEAAAVPTAGIPAQYAMRSAVKPGRTVLISGAGGGVGSFAVQIACALGGVVTGVCSAGNAELVRSLGASHVIDYIRDGEPAGPYDVILENVGARSLTSLRAALAPGGTLFWNAGGSPGKTFGALGSFLRVGLTGLVARGQSLRPVPTQEKREDLLALTELIEAGSVKPVVTGRYSMENAAEAVARVETGHTRGKLVVVLP